MSILSFRMESNRAKKGLSVKDTMAFVIFKGPRMLKELSIFREKIIELRGLSLNAYAVEHGSSVSNALVSSQRGLLCFYKWLWRLGCRLEAFMNPVMRQVGGSLSNMLSLGLACRKRTRYSWILYQCKVTLSFNITSLSPGLHSCSTCSLKAYSPQNKQVHSNGYKTRT
jgi:hypothetical protein